MFGLSHYRATVHSLVGLAMQTNKGIVLAQALVEYPRRQVILLPSVNVIERICAKVMTAYNPPDLQNIDGGASLGRASSKTRPVAGAPSGFEIFRTIAAMHNQ
ncbi:Transposase (plasmid) [Mycetohabitans rhizoxinica HKI 454]|uniref:Transposase n=2 Tax=Burkholderiaceae TaxID=119060 RepID=E5AV25_MYCRK|nr:Transposase [Mycetohabitans rhizoxinica HKI 454]